MWAYLPTGQRSCKEYLQNCIVDMATSFKMNTFLNNSYHKDYYLQRSSFEFFVLPICLFTLVKVLVKQEGRKIDGFPL